MIPRNEIEAWAVVVLFNPVTWFVVILVAVLLSL